MLQMKVGSREQQEEAAERQIEKGLRGRLLGQVNERTLLDVVALEFPDVKVKTLRVHRDRFLRSRMAHRAWRATPDRPHHKTARRRRAPPCHLGHCVMRHSTAEVQ